MAHEIEISDNVHDISFLKYGLMLLENPHKLLTSHSFVFACEKFDKTLVKTWKDTFIMSVLLGKATKILLH
jgi:hypothetical protein